MLRKRASRAIFYFYNVQKQERNNCILMGDSFSKTAKKSKEVTETQVRTVLISRKTQGVQLRREAPEALSVITFLDFHCADLGALFLIP